MLNCQLSLVLIVDIKVHLLLLNLACEPDTVYHSMSHQTTCSIVESTRRKGGNESVQMTDTTPNNEPMT